MAIRVDLGRIPMSRTLLRVSAPRSPRSVKRCLFDAVDHSDVRRQLAKESDARLDRFRRQYNFDLRTETPLPGRYDWSDSPVSTTTTTTTIQARDAVASDATQEVRPAAIASQVPVTSERRESESRQVSITAFFQSRKRRSQESDKMTSPVPSKVLRQRALPQLPTGGQ
uniref:Putative cyclin-dependent kinase inhibitor n=1 Tax=Ixodes ricinus TaxID=34613 RepID=A0A131Y7A1_IXORI